MKEPCPSLRDLVQTPDASLVEVMSALMSSVEVMLEEAQTEARFCHDREDALLLLAKRDALNELMNRLRHGKRNRLWARIRPQVTLGL